MGRKTKAKKKAVEGGPPNPPLQQEQLPNHKSVEVAVGPPPPPPLPPAPMLEQPSKAKKKTIKGTGGPPPPPPPPPAPLQEKPSKPKKKEDENDRIRTYKKIKAIFKCSGEKCSKKWSSVHAWEREEIFYCDLCGEEAERLDVKDEMCELDNFVCETPTCLGNRWQSIHGDTERSEDCDICGASVKPSGIQERFGRHFWFACVSPSCGEGWEDFSLTPQKTQRCSRCKSRGDIVGTRKIRENSDGDSREGNGGGGYRGAMAHNWENCDMCQDLKGQGKAQTCLKYRKVHCQVVKLAEGVYTERITGLQ